MCKVRVISSFLLAFLVAVSSSIFRAQTHQPTDQPYHQTDMSGAGNSSSTRAARRPQPVAAHTTFKGVALSKLEVLPTSISITGPRYTQRVVVEATFVDGRQEDVTAEAQITSIDPRIVRVDQEGLVWPQSDGRSTLTATFRGQRGAASVEVLKFSAPFEWSFRNDVIPVMTKVGCNQGACHGAAAGKNGFKLTLRGYDPETDYYTLTHQALARRTERLEPAKSLILLKPTLTIAHGGGKRFAVGSTEYQVISGWIADGMPKPQESDPRVASIEVLPSEASLGPEAEQQLVVTAVFTDGHREDVTRWAKYDSGDEGVAAVDQDGHVKMHGYGEAPVTVWYQSHVTFARLRIPYPYSISADVYKNAPRHNYIDDYVLKHLQVLHIPPSSPAGDAEFIRRVYLDAAGILPTPAEVERFLKDTAPGKRKPLIEQLLRRPEFVDYWAYKWSDLLLVSSNHLSDEGMWSYYNWIRESVAADKPWNQFVNEIVTATGNARENGAANYWAIHRDPLDISENMTQAFLGITITCAHCHNHPLAKWTQKDYYGMANLFARVRLKTSGRTISRVGVGPVFEDVTVYSNPWGQFIDDRYTKPLPPKPLAAAALPADSPQDPRLYFAQWLTSPENPFFARAIVNRVWRSLMGRGLVEPADDMRDTNPATNAELLDALVKDFIKHNYDIDYLVETILESATYQASSRPNDQNAQDEQYYSHYLIRRLPAEVLLDAYSQVTQEPEKFEGYPPGTRALQLPDAAVRSYFLTAFGRPARQQTRESERTSVPTVTQALHIINGDTLNYKLRDAGNSIDMLIKLGFSDEEIVNYLYLASLSRYPAEAERAALLNALREAESAKVQGISNPRRAALSDMAWALLTSEEFVFNH
ncbi:MAG: DUF1549 domain-containing protein [Terriglobia bacterium]